MNSWIDEELATGDLGDKRLDDRFAQMLSRLFDSPQSSMCGAMKGWAEVMAACRFFNNPLVTIETLLQPHYDATLQRVQTQKRVLNIQDTSELDYTLKTQLTGSGPLNYDKRRGFFAHTQWIVGDNRLPLGVWHTNIQAREELNKTALKGRAFEEKESYRWLQGYVKACELGQKSPDVEVISVSDREGDIYEIFAERARRIEVNEFAVHLVTRCCQPNRALLPQEKPENSTDQEEQIASKLEAEVLASHVLGTIQFRVENKTNYKKIKRKRVKVVRQAREIIQEVRACKIVLKPPAKKGHLPSVTLWAVSGKEINPPEGQEPIDWLILTSMPVESFEKAKEILEIYLARWEIEVFHRVLKTGCKIEELQLKDSSRLKPALGLYMIIAWRILYLTKLGRECPELPCDAVFDEAEWKSIVVISKGREALKNKPTLGEMILLIAKQGGYLGRKCDGPPGPQVMWIGLMHLQSFAVAWKAFGEPNSS